MTWGEKPDRQYIMLVPREHREYLRSRKEKGKD